MKINKNTQIIGERVILIPYLKKHVIQYHEWMKKPELLDLTASEPLTLKEEYEMQTSWHVDPEKLTFLLVDKNVENRQREDGEKRVVDSEGNHSGSVCEEPPFGNQLLCGDVNLFIQPDFDDLGLNIAELEVMIAEMQSRRKGIALEALKILILYSIEKLNIDLFVVHVLSHNEVSKTLFEEKLGFEVETFQEWSKEWILKRKVDPIWIEELRKELSYLEYKFIEWDGVDSDYEGEESGEEAEIEAEDYQEDESEAVEE